MVHALGEIWRVLVEDGVLIDFRPLHSKWRIDVVADGDIFLIDDGIDDAPRLHKDVSAEGAVNEVLAKAWFVRESATQIEYARHWQQVDEMVTFWADKSPPLCFPDETLARARQMLTAKGHGAEVRVVHPLTLGVYRKNREIAQRLDRAH